MPRGFAVCDYDCLVGFLLLLLAALFAEMAGVLLHLTTPFSSRLCLCVLGHTDTRIPISLNTDRVRTGTLYLKSVHRKVGQRPRFIMFRCIFYIFVVCLVLSFDIY